MQLKMVVYGTLKRNRGNHACLGDSQFLGTGTVQGILWVDPFEGYPRINTTQVEYDQLVTVEVFLINNFKTFRGIAAMEIGAAYYPKPILIPGYGECLIWESERPIGDKDWILPSGVF